MKFEEKLEKLEQMSREIQNPETDLEKAVSLYEEGMKLAGELEKDLSKLERRVEIVTSAPGSGEVIAAPFDEDIPFGV